MYWLVGAPRAHHQDLPKLAQLHGHDGLDLSRRGRRELRRTQTGQSTSGQSDVESTGRRHGGGVDGGRQSASSATNADDGTIIGMSVSAHGHIFATISKTALFVWLLKSLESYGANVGVLSRPDADVFVIRTQLGFLITYNLVAEPEGKAYSLLFADGGKLVRRRSHVGVTGKFSYTPKKASTAGVDVGEAKLQFRMVMRLDAGILQAVALEQELVVITSDPPALQCIQWSSDRSGSQFLTEPTSYMTWLKDGTTLVDVVHDRSLNVFAFISSDGLVYAARKLPAKPGVSGTPGRLFDGRVVHTPSKPGDLAAKVALNPQFSLIAVGCADGSISVYEIRNQIDDIRFIRKFELAASSTAGGAITILSYSPDGQCLFVGFEHGWTTWSCFGQAGSWSFGRDPNLCRSSGDAWLTSSHEGLWVADGAELLLLPRNSDCLWTLQFARNALAACFTPANTYKGLLQTSTELIVYQGEQLPEMMTITMDDSLWKDVEVPTEYLEEQWPIRATAISPDQRYIAVAGQQGLVHYSLQSGRWRTAPDPEEQKGFRVSGGMCWLQNLLVAAIETKTRTFELRLYAREAPLDNQHVLDTVTLDAPVVVMSPIGEDAILVYTYDSVLEHYVIDFARGPIKFSKFGRVVLQGIISTPSKVRAISPIVSPPYLQEGEIPKDIASTPLLFLIGGTLTLLLPKNVEGTGGTHDPRVVARHVEFYTLARDNQADLETESSSPAQEAPQESSIYTLKDSLWVFDGRRMRIWPDVLALLDLAAERPSAVAAASVSVALDFYPFSVSLSKGIIVGAESILMQRRDVNFAHFKTVARTTLFIPDVLRHHLTQFGTASALRVAEPFEPLPYFSHALEVLLHTVLEEEAERRPASPRPRAPGSGGDDNENDNGDGRESSPPPPASLLPAILAFLATFPQYLDVVLRCTRKTELRSWQTLFDHLPPPGELFATSLRAGRLKTAGGYLLVLQQHQQDGGGAADGAADSADNAAQVVPAAVELLRAAQRAHEWGLCKELARFLVALDEGGATLRGALLLADAPAAAAA